MVLLNSTNEFEASFFPILKALSLSFFMSLKAKSPAFILLRFVNATQDGIISFWKSVFIITGSPFSILHIAELVVPKSMP